MELATRCLADDRDQARLVERRDLADGPDLGALAAGYVLVTAIVGPLAARWSDRIPSSR